MVAASGRANPGQKHDLALRCGHHFYADIKNLAKMFGYSDVEAWCPACANWSEIYVVLEHQGEMTWLLENRDQDGVNIPELIATG